MGLNDRVSAERIHIGFFGLRNAGKSSVVNAVTGQKALSRFGSQRNDHRPGSEGDGASAARSRGYHRHSRNR